MQAVPCEVFVNQYIIGILLFVQIFIWKKRYRILHKKEVEYMEIGKKYTQKTVVSEKDTALAHGSGTLRVYATPAMIALMENTAMNLAAPYLSDDEATVGTEINIKHVSATPVGGAVSCEAELIEEDGRCLVFKVSAFDDKGIICEGTHKRFVIKTEKFLVKTYDKLK